MINWYLNRLKTISIAEMPYRVKQLVRKWYEKSFSAGKFPESKEIGINDKLLEFSLLSNDPLKDHIEIFGKSFDFTQPDIDWHQDIFTGSRFPMSFSKAINIRSTSNISAKNVWEINRLQFLPSIALNYKRTGSDVYMVQFINILNSWIRQNPYLLGINWYSNIEVNIRLINWFLAWEILEAEQLIDQKEDFSDFVKNKWLPSIYQHCQYSYQNPSKYSSANNHLISEYAGLFLATSKWKFKESDKWLAYAKEGLEEEIQKQHSSGVNKEEAAEYIQFITDFFLLPYIIGKRIGRVFSKQYESQLRDIFYYIFHFTDCKGNFPQYGDEDDGRCYFLDLDENFNNFKSILTSGAILFQDPVLKSKSNGFDLKNNILFGEKGKADFESLPEKMVPGSSKFYEKEGHFIFRKIENGREIYLHFDAAPLGFLSIAAHGHADALSFILHIDGQPLFIDSGTYTYHTEPEWRKYFIGTLAHNTIRINQKDQAENGGPTLWIKHYESKVVELESGKKTERIKATHNGYTKEKVQHIREVIFHRAENEFHLKDTIVLSDNKQVELEIPFHFHPEVLISKLDTNSYDLTVEGTPKATFTIDQKLEPLLIRGQLEPQIMGWYSKSFLKKEPTNVLYNKINIEHTTTFEFVIKII